METIYIHADLNKFYASIIRSWMPWLEKDPLIVLSNNDGCSICQTKEAELFGVRMGTPEFEIRDVIEKNNIRVFSCNFPLIAEVSLRVKSIMRRYVPELEDYSIDEMFGRFDGVPASTVVEICREIVRVMKRGLGLPISIGIAHTKTLAKVATRFAKKHKGYRGVCLIDTEYKRRKALKLTEIGDIWGIGRQYRKKLQKKGVENAYDFVTKIPHAWVRKEMTVVGERTYRELQGISCLDLEMIAPPKKNIMVSRSFGKDILDIDNLCRAITTYVCMAAAKLRRQGSKAKSVYVFLHSNPFKDYLPQDYRSICIPLPVATSSSIELGEYVRTAMKAMYRKGINYKKSGVMVMELCDEDAVQANLFDCRDRRKEDRAMKAVDALNGRYGLNTVIFGGQGVGPQEWKIRQEKLPPYWSTRLSDLPLAVDYPFVTDRTDHVIIAERDSSFSFHIVESGHDKGQRHIR